MKDEIKEILEMLRKYGSTNDKVLLDYITELQEELEYVRKQNNDLRKIYRNTYKRYQEQGNDEMAGYFMAQIDDCPTFYVEPIIDYYELSKQLQEELEEEKRIEQEDLKTIMNLQEELEEEKKDFKEANDYCFELKDYKTRVDKAIEYNYELQERYCHSALYDEPVASKIYEISEKELNILQGSDKE